MAALLCLAVAAPLAASIVVRVAPRFAAAGALLAAVPPWLLLIRAAGGDEGRTTLQWLPTAGLDVGLRLDGLSAAMTATVATVGLIVVVYSVGYFADEPRRASALAGLLAFLAAMQGLVLADGYLALLVFWELVGAASARLIAFSRDDPRAPAATTRAFLTTRSADIGFYVAVLGLFAATGSVAFTDVRPDGAFGTMVGLGLVLAAMGKSAQAPLQTWLSAAMAGPTPVSALLHSATMVAAGVYLLVRSHDLLAGWPLDVAGWVGALTAVAGAAIALGQSDLKRVLAGSTTSQLGLMFLGAAAGGPAVAIFHLIAHAAGKAGLFLSTGVLQHARRTTELEGLRGAGRDDRAAFAAFSINALSIAAVPPLTGFWSKDGILAASQDHIAWFVLALVSAAGSAAYLLRPWLVLADRESGAVARRGRRPMLAGVAATAVGSLALGLAVGPLAALLRADEPAASSLGVVLSLVAVAIGAATVLLPMRAPAALAEAARDQFHTNALLRSLAERPLFLAARMTDVIERRVVDSAVDAIGRAGLAAARSTDEVERRFIDAAVDGLAMRIRAAGETVRRLQSGRLFEYLRDAVLGGAAVGALLLLSALL